MNLKSMKEMNSLIMESQDIQSGEFISDKEKSLMESQLDGVAVVALPEKEYVVSEEKVESSCKCGNAECTCGCENDLCTCCNEIDGAAGTSEKDVEAVMGCAETLPENLGITNSLSAKPTLKESASGEEYVIWGIPPNGKYEELLVTKFKGNIIDSMDTAEKLADVLKSKHGVSDVRIAQVNMSEKPDFSGTVNESAEVGTVIEEQPMKDAQEGANIEDKVITKFNDMFLKEYKPQSDVKFDLDASGEAEVEIKEFKIPKGW